MQFPSRCGLSSELVGAGEPAVRPLVRASALVRARIVLCQRLTPRSCFGGEVAAGADCAALKRSCGATPSLLQFLSRTALNSYNCFTVFSPHEIKCRNQSDKSEGVPQRGLSCTAFFFRLNTSRPPLRRVGKRILRRTWN